LEKIKNKLKQETKQKLAKGAVTGNKDEELT